MPYGDRINPVTDDFSTNPFAGRWGNGHADWDVFTWTATDYVVGAAGDSAMRRDNEGAYPNNQYSRITLQNTSVSGWGGCAVRMQNSTTDESCYIFYFVEDSDFAKGIWEISSAFGFTELATSTATAKPIAGEFAVCEAEGTTVRGGSNESGVDTQELTTTDATIASGRPGITSFTNGQQFDAWEGGEIGVAGGASSLAMISRSRRLYNQLMLH